MAAPFGDAPPYPAYTFETPEGTAPGWSMRGIAALSVLVLGAAGLIARGGAARLAALVALALLAFNLALHSVWGDEFFVYSQHWTTPMLVLAAGLVRAPRGRRIGEVAVTILCVAVAATNIDTVGQLLAAIAPAAPGAGIQ